MASIIEEIFDEYVQMRENGLDTQEVLRALRIYVEPLSKLEKETLAQHLRAWERGRSHESKLGMDKSASAIPPPPPPSSYPVTPPPSASSSIIKPLSKPASTAVPDSSAPPEVAWVECRNCHKKNRVNDVFCYSCGQLLETAMTQFDTRTFADGTNRHYRDEYFGAESVLVLNVVGLDDSFEVRPQARTHEIVLGRLTGNGAMAPDLDLSRAGAAEQGVSRLHLALRYEAADSTLQIYDLGSANGSYVNGQKLHPKELRVLRNGDEIRLGRLALRAVYMHPGDEINS